MADQGRERWSNLVADFEASDLTQREPATDRGISFSNLCGSAVTAAPTPVSGADAPAAQWRHVEPGDVREASGGVEGERAKLALVL